MAAKTLLWFQEQQKRQCARYQRRRRRAGLAVALSEGEQRHSFSGGSSVETKVFETAHQERMDRVGFLQRQLREANIRTALKVDPKISFANERTMLHYTQKALYLAGASIA